MLVLRDTTTGKCFITDFDELDAESVENCGFEIAGTVANSHRIKLEYSENFEEMEDDEDTPSFTTCEHDGCAKWLMIDCEGMAPEYCAEHEGEGEK